MSWTTYTVLNFADDLHWPELGMLLESIEAAGKASFLGSMCEDPLMVAIHFERRFDALMKHVINTLRPRQNGRHFADDSFKRIFLNENVWFSIKISLKFVPRGLINNIPALFQIMAWRRPGDKPLSETMLARLLTHICVTRPQWVNSQEHPHGWVTVTTNRSYHQPRWRRPKTVRPNNRGYQENLAVRCAHMTLTCRCHITLCISTMTMCFSSTGSENLHFEIFRKLVVTVRPCWS